MSFVNY